MADKPACCSVMADSYTAGIFAGRKKAYGAKLLGWRGTGLVRDLTHTETSHMAIEAHLAELEKRHQALELEINEAMTHPSADDLEIAQLKRKKLYVKDEITRLRQDVFVH
jgi:hypothetical protein